MDFDLLPTFFDTSYRVKKKLKSPLDEEALRRALEEVIDSDELPPPSLLAVARQLNTTGSTLWYHFSELCRRISAKHKQYQQDCKLKNIDSAREEVRRIARELHADGVEPTTTTIGRRMSKPGYLREPLVEQEAVNIRRELVYESP